VSWGVSKQTADPCTSSTGGLTISVWGCVSSTHGKFAVSPERAFVLGHSTMQLHFCSPVLPAVLCRLPAGAFVSQAPSFSTWFLCWRFQLSQNSSGNRWLCPAPTLGSAAGAVGSASLQTFLHVFCCFDPFRFL
jgi:hypothetical protein